MQSQQNNHKFDRPLVKEATVEKEMLNPSSVIAPNLFSLEDVQRELADVHEEIEETCAVADNVRAVPESAHEETLSLLTQLPHNVPMPDMMWLEDGGIGLEWRPGDGIATMSIYGDNFVIFGAFFSNKRELDGICALSDTVLLDGFVTTLRNLFQ